MQPKKVKPLTLCMIHKDSKILLAMKKRGFGAGRWNGYGGKLAEGETLEQAALREIQEESGITSAELEKKGIITFEFENDPVSLEVHIFDVTSYEGEPVETEEMKPQWFDIDKIPYEQMWSDDPHWLPLLLEGKKFRGKFLFDRPSTAEYSAKIISQELQKVESL